MQINDALQHLNRLPAFPAVLQEVVASLNAKAVNMEALAHTIGLDEALTAKILRVANSAFYGFPREIASVQEALVILGLGGVQSLVLSAGLVQAFDGPGGSLDRDAHWQQSFRVGIYARTVARCIRASSDVAFTAGMLHNIGQLALDVCLPEQFAEATARAEEMGGLMAAEEAVLGFNHAALGAELARRWNFPGVIERAIRDCHAGPTADFEPVTGAVAVAIALEEGATAEAALERLPAPIRERYALDGARLVAELPASEIIEAGIEALIA